MNEDNLFLLPGGEKKIDNLFIYYVFFFVFYVNFLQKISQSQSVPLLKVHNKISPLVFLFFF
jgi:hypothetical protein